MRRAFLSCQRSAARQRCKQSACIFFPGNRTLVIGVVPPRTKTWRSSDTKIKGFTRGVVNCGPVEERRSTKMDQECHCS